MVTVFGGYVESRGDGYFCIICEENCDSLKTILEHCRYSPRHQWDERCRLVFATVEAKEDHLLHSPLHHVCYDYEDKPDFKNEYKLENHRQTSHFWCRACGTFDVRPAMVLRHICEVKHERDKCSRTFKDGPALHKHMAFAHGTRSFECPGCRSRVFMRFSHLLEHLERSTCGVPWRLKTLAFRYSDHDAYGTKTTDKEPFYCGGCRNSYADLSPLYSHVEEKKECNHLLQAGKPLHVLRDFIIENFIPSRC